MSSKKNFKTILYIGLILIVITSCTPQKELRYFQQPEEETKKVFTYEYPQGESNYSPKYKLEEKDVLYIQIKSSVDIESNKMFSENNSYYSTQNESSIYLNSYVIDNNGEINVPIVGKVKLKGLSIEEARQLIEDKVS
ncbi:MAG: polysaccharide biosynthesis/export family protein, partial [Bacteroidales bacterium]|nr:polysaccharide biosynthesis/export family protein [Bacteroidales bacterium]